MNGQRYRQSVNQMLSILSVPKAVPLPNPLLGRPIETRIAILAANAELKHARALGAGWFEAYGNALRVLDEIRDLADRPMPCEMLTRFRAMGRS